MSQIYNVYCDESCHLENDHQSTMVLGAVWCPLSKVREIATRIKEIKIKNNLNPDFEIKWTKVSPAKQQFYLDVLDYFFDDDDLHFRVLVVPDKTKLRHNAFGQSHDDWYYKMYFSLLKAIFDPNASYRVYIDIKDTRSAKKVEHLQDFLCDDLRDYSRDVVEHLQHVRSHEVAILQLSDLLIGAVNYANRALSSSEAKNKLVERMRARSKYPLTKSTLLREQKVNIFVWKAKEGEQ